MNKPTKIGASRREFMQLVTGGALTLSAGHSSGRTVPANCTEERTGFPIDWEAVKAVSGPKAEPVYQDLDLNGTWSVTSLPLEVEGDEGYRILTDGGHECFEAKVPGEIHLDLMRAGRMPDPQVGDNARTRCRWPERRSWWYRTEFNLPVGFRRHLRQRLIFEGIDLYGQIFLNGQRLGTAKNAFATSAFDVKSLLRDDANELVVRVTSGMELSPPVPVADWSEWLDPLYALRSGDSHIYSYLRKPDYSTYGTDFCDPLPNIGIWRGVGLEGRSGVIIHHLRLDTVIGTSEVSLVGEVILENLHPWSELTTEVELRLEPPDGPAQDYRLRLGVPVGRFAVPCRIVVSDPLLWWPNGMGEQPLYRLTARVLSDGKESNRVTQVIGLRTVELDRSSLPEGSRFGIKINGVRVFCKGGNWAPADLIAARVDTRCYQALVEAARKAHFTMLRVNGVGLYESDEFYEACDRAGILIWQDFAFSDAQYPDNEESFRAEVRREAKAAIRRLRHHASLALWCGNSECIMTFFYSSKGDPISLDTLGGVRLYNEVLPDVCRTYDPGRPYWPGSPFGGPDPNNEIAGDTHSPYWWIPANVFPDPFSALLREKPRKRALHMSRLLAGYQEVLDHWRGRFVSEYGVIGPPNMASVREYLGKGDESRHSTGWKIHSNEFEMGTTEAGIRYYYGNPELLSLEAFVHYGQMYQALLHGALIEALRFRKDDPLDDCEGALMWSYNDTWGETGWSIVDYYGRRKASYYAVKRGNAPVKVLVRSRQGHLLTRAVNDTRDAYTITVRCGWVRLDGRAHELQSHPIKVPENGMVEVAKVPIPSPSERDPRAWLYAALMTGEHIPADQAVWLLAPHRELTLSRPDIASTVRDGMLEVKSGTYCHGVHLQDGGQEILADNYFDLLPGIPRRIAISMPRRDRIYPLVATMPLAYES
jgi:beta-mannosidase